MDLTCHEALASPVRIEAGCSGAERPFSSADGSGGLAGEEQRPFAVGDWEQPALQYVRPERNSEELTELLLHEARHTATADGSYFAGIAAQQRRYLADWTLAACKQLRFSSHTGALAISMLDRFQCTNRTPDNQGWALLLAGVACLSIAAKVEEPEPGVVFEQLQKLDCSVPLDAERLKNMEFVVLDVLDWRVASLTPHSFVDFLLRSAPRWQDETTFMREYSLIAAVRSAAGKLLEDMLRDVAFVGFKASALAAAALLHTLQDFVAPGEFSSTAKVIRNIVPKQVDVCSAVLRHALGNAATPSPHERFMRETSPQSSASCDTTLDA